MQPDIPASVHDGACNRAHALPWNSCLAARCMHCYRICSLSRVHGQLILALLAAHPSQKPPHRRSWQLRAASPHSCPGWDVLYSFQEKKKIISIKTKSNAEHWHRTQHERPNSKQSSCWKRFPAKKNFLYTKHQAALVSAGCVLPQCSPHCSLPVSKGHGGPRGAGL